MNDENAQPFAPDSTSTGEAASNSPCRDAKLGTLTDVQRRVLGVLVEKAFTTPANYPLTLTALVTACNQKSNRDPVTDYDDYEVQDALEQLASLELVKTIYPESGSTERFRHLARKRFEFNEPQLAIMTELWLRGSQTLGELRTRASRMVPINTLEALRDQIESLVESGCVAADGALSKRGVKVDHTFYTDEENLIRERLSGGAKPQTADSSADDGQLTALTARVDALAAENSTLREQIQTLREEVDSLAEKLSELRSDVHG